jgi:hypothetical protein
MNDLIDIREKLEDTHSAITRLREDLAAEPNDRRLALMLESLEQRQDSLEATFYKVANVRQLEVCSYRLIRENAQTVFPIAVVGETLKTFQSWLTVVFDAIKNGPKMRSRPAADIVQRTTLDFGYTFPGSLGVVFTVPSERDLFDFSELDRCVDGMFHMLRVHTPEELVRFARSYGVSAVRRMYDWANNHSSYAVSVDIKWRRGEKIRNEIFVQSPEATRLCELIDSTSDVTSEEIAVTGELVGGDTVTRNFHMRFLSAEDIKGQIADNFTYVGNLTLERNYRARILRSKIIRYATEQEDYTYRLLNLEPAD